MNILDLVEEFGVFPKKVASTHGGEYKSSCPKCQDGKDRFCIWPNQGVNGRYWCRVCNCRGDAIQFCRDFLEMTFHQACQRMNKEPKFQKKNIDCNPFKTVNFIPQISKSATEKWKISAKAFIETSHKQLINNSKVLKLLNERGLSFDTICKSSLGWNSTDLFEERNKWGLPKIIKENGYFKKQWLPKGIVIPAFNLKDPIKIKIRRKDWHPKDNFPKYVEVAGSCSSPSIYGDISKPLIIVESELDAILIQQHASHLICSLALGGVGKKPNHDLHEILKKASLILLSLDYDESGKNKYAFWMKNYSNVTPWPAPSEKSIGDALKYSNINIASWISKGLF
ncbi:MAG: hypothetical protein ACFFG0_34990 [Candidatus Thorarchaeota archaeon]